MKNYFGNFKIVLLIAVMLVCMGFMHEVFPAGTGPPPLVAEPAEAKPLSFSSMDFPKEYIILKASENNWLEKGDFVYSIYTLDGSYYASWDVAYKQRNLIIKSFASDPEHPVKTGLINDEAPVWGLWRDNLMTLLLLTTYQDNYYTYGMAELTNEALPVNDNLYYSLDPIWPEIAEYKILPPLTGKWIYFRDVVAYRGLMPKYVEGTCKLEICEGLATVRNGKYFNETQVKFTASDIQNGFINIRIRGQPLKNSKVKSTAKNYRLYWN